MKRFLKTVIICVLFALLINAGFANLEDEIKLNEEAKKQLQEELKQIDQQQAENAAAQSVLEGEVQALNEEIRVVDARIEELTDDIAETQRAIEVKTDELNQAIEDEANQNERMKRRLRTMYKAGNFSYLEILMGADDFSDMMTHLDKIQILLDYDETMLTELIDIRQFIADTKVQLEETEANLVRLKEEKVAEQLVLKTKQTELQAKQAELENEEQALLNIESQVVADADELTKILKKQYADKKAQELAKLYQGGAMQWPVPLDYKRISSDFGMRMHPVLKRRMLHTGIDIPAPKGTAIYAATAGQVVHSGWLGSYGYAIIVDHGGGIMTLYGHCSKLISKADSYVERGQRIAEVGTSGRSTGNHVHFEVRKNGEYVDPKPYVMNK